MPTKLLDLPVLPPAVLAALSSFGAGAAGLFLIVSSFVGGARIAFFAIPAAAIPILGPRLRCLPWPASTRASFPASSAQPSWPPDCSSPASRSGFSLTH